MFESLKSETIISQFITGDPERANLFTNIYLYKLAYCLLRIVSKRLENDFPEIDFSKFFHICMDSDCHPKRVYELVSCNLTKKNKRQANYTIFELITHVFCSTLAVYDKNICEELGQEHLESARAYFYDLQQKVIDKQNGSYGVNKRDVERIRVKNEVIRLYESLDDKQKTKPATQLYNVIYRKLKQFMEKEKMSKQEYTPRVIEGYIREHRKNIKNIQSRG
ncbi:hypothetical protein [Legionella sainthelensi]|uniref:Uncharacterized protein n=1 Tax=Legionella sainthelensi TaxID=28087 RepID=A0A2H5FLP8_9GAMM|nr:hypothetical protein [Legionella sainthelensi]AUH72476.1 hypothetical protein CAB17_10695 [Legionella sainthelensi]